MNVPERRHLIAWIAVLLAVVASLRLASYRLSGLPDLGMLLGPDLQVRSVYRPALAQAESPKFKPGDYFVALEGTTLKSLRDLRVLLRSLPAEKKLRPADDGEPLRYQLLRPEHRYTISWQGNREDPTALPPGYNPKTDDLIEIDGRRLPEPVDPEGVRSVLGHRSDALLTFKRHNAVFQGTAAFWPSSSSWSVPLVFGLVGLLGLLLWRYHSRELPRESSLAVAVETVSFGWILMLAVAYQWLLADPVLASFTILGLIAIRPLAIFARTRAARDEDDTVGWWALGLGGGYALLVLTLLHSGALPDAETALHAGACGTALYLVYEFFSVAFDDAPHTTLQEGGGYLAGILMVGFATAIFIWQFQGEVFRHQLWRWFAIAFTALVGFGDLLFCFRGPSGVGYDELLTPQQRRDGIRRYLEEVAKDLPESRVLAVVQRQGMAIAVELTDDGLEIGPAPDRVADVVSILVREQSRIPLPEIEERGTNPLSGLAQTMDIALALRLRPPPGAMELPDSDVALLAFEKAPDSELPSFASPATIDRAQRELAPSVWAALFIEAVAHLPESVDELLEEAKARATEDDAPDEPDENRAEGEAEPERVGELENQLEEARERIEFLREDRSSLAAQLQVAERRLRAYSPPVDEYEQLLEPELIETLEFLLESDEPIAVGGPYGAGKEFTARCAAQMEGHAREAFVVYDALDRSGAGDREELFGDEEEGTPGYVENAVGGALLVRGAGRLNDTLLVGLCNSAVEKDLRLFLAFHEPDIESHSPLDERSPRVVEQLEHRELMIPSLRNRPSVLPNILNFYLQYYADLRDKPVESFTQEALAAFRSYAFPAEVREAKLLVDLAILRSEGSEVELSALNAEVREGA